MKEMQAMEALEGRVLLSRAQPFISHHHSHHHVQAVPQRQWSYFAHLLGQDLVAENYPWLNGQGMGVAMVDTGVDYTHPAFQGHDPVTYGHDFTTGSSYYMDLDGHGTGVAGMLAAKPYTLDGIYNQGLVQGATFLALKQTGADTIAAALQWVVDNHQKYNVVAVNLTDFIGGGGFNHVRNAYDKQLAELGKLGIVVSSPVGNGGAATPIDYPNTDPNVIGCGGIDSRTGGIWEKTQRDPNLKVLAAGYGVSLPFDDYARPVDQRQQFTNYGQGTSWAAPFMTATATLIKQIDPTATPAQILQIVRDTGTPIADPATGITYPRLNMDAAVTAAYRQFDDAYQGNTSAAKAAPLTFHKGQASAGNLKLLVGKDDWYSFTLEQTTRVSLGVTYAGPSAFPSADLLGPGKKGALKDLASIGPTGAAADLAPGTYYLHLSSPMSLSGAYGLGISTGAVRTGHLHRAAPAARPATAAVATITETNPARPAAAAPFSTRPIRPWDSTPGLFG